ncbi:Exodeoxyribonuclease 7 large subunit [Flavobacterium bizetiae]|uniref:Exodeoxyribonuclease 7 large subunit n=1 Tax=Flavobacterium bizetiae TaxID=2704140 RepID=A0A6J4GB55_9FLAO|nr:exodeoxyribonuclease VII large subunit [Flavobacterium bizetiae]CAA9194872.1 Exodeoxyribonuclease 7 large subunit [Flavobacterium bizetiae]CAD5342524.1 Exodeoxyribonuclease 7 large subunit [Flavobacterium bizetiae]CAD5348440.1 Exodeoxyribonuclease 7 large subunit [Flavobacterium bizetiae]
MGPQKHIKLSELNAKISDALTDRFKGQTFWVVADITNHSYKADKKIHYFELVEKGATSNSIVAKIIGKAWGAGSMHLSDFEKNTGQSFTNNINVLVLVSVDYHPLFGLSLNVLDIDTNFTLGILEQQRNATLKRLVDENDFIEKKQEQYITFNNQLQLRAVIQRVAVLSGSNSAGHEDFRHTLEHNDFGYVFQIDDYPTIVQGDNNAKLFLSKLIDIYKSGILYDAVVITRGGGAQSDFLIFDNYNIGRAVAKFPIPIITGIGHQKNVSITDLMAHTHTKTPTKAAEFIIAHNRSFEQSILLLQKNIVIKSQQLFLLNYQNLSGLKSTISNSARELISAHKDALGAINQNTINSSKTILYHKHRQLVNISHQIAGRPRIILYNRINDIENTISNLKTFTNQYLRNQGTYLGHYRASIRMISPENILKKGYAIIRVNGKITSNADTIDIGDTIDVVFSDTILKTTVREKTKYNGRETHL